MVICNAKVDTSGLGSMAAQALNALSQGVNDVLGGLMAITTLISQTSKNAMDRKCIKTLPDARRKKERRSKA